MEPDYTTPRWESSALLLIDVQNDFVDGAATVPGTADAIPAMAELAAAFRAAGRPVVHVVRLYPPGGSDVDPVRRAAVEAGAQIVAPGTVGARIPDALLPAGPDSAGAPELDAALLLSGAPQPVGELEWVLFKPRWSAFHRTRLADLLAGHGVTTVAVAGCNLPNCPRATLFDATERDLRAVLVTDATSAVTAPRVSDLELIGVHPLTADRVRAGLRAPG